MPVPAFKLFRRARTFPALLLALAVALPVAVAVPLTSASPAAADTTPDRTMLDRMQAQAAKAQRELEAGTRALEEGQRKLAKEQKQAATTRAAAGDAQAKVKAARLIVDRYAAAAYRHGVPNAVQAIVDSDGTGLSELLHSAGFLQIVDRGNGDALRQVEVARQDAMQLSKRADQLVASTAKDKAELDRRTVALQAQAAQAGEQMQKALAAYEAAVEKARQEKAAREAAARAKAAREAAAKQAAANAARDAAARPSEAACRPRRLRLRQRLPRLRAPARAMPQGSAVARRGAGSPTG